MTIQFFELASPEHVRSLESGTRISFGMTSPGSWITVNPNLIPILDEIKRRAPLGIERIHNADYEAELFDGTREELLARRAEMRGHWQYPCSGDGCSGWKVGDVVASSNMDRELGYPEFLFVLQTSERYDENEKEYHYEALCRQATEQEAYPLIAEKAASK